MEAKGLPPGASILPCRSCEGWLVAWQDSKLACRRQSRLLLTHAAVHAPRQGWGNLVNTAVLCILLTAFGQTGTSYNRRSLDAVWRISFGVGLVPVTGMLIYRLLFLQESKVWVRQKKSSAVRGASLLFPLSLPSVRLAYTADVNSPRSELSSALCN